MGPNSGNRVALSMKTVRATIVTPIWATENVNRALVDGPLELGLGLVANHRGRCD
jgi:hypothetical protein